MKKLKRLTTLLLTAAMVMAFLPAFSLTAAAEADVPSITDVITGGESVVADEANNTYSESTYSAYISVIDAADGETLLATFFDILDERGFQVSECVSVGETIELIDLKVNEEYTIKVHTPTAGYSIPEDIRFKVNESGNINCSGTLTTDDEGKQVIELKLEKTKVHILAAENGIFGTALEGATLQVLDKLGNPVEEWVSEAEPYEIEGLIIGEEYTIRTVIVPDGYVLPTDKTLSIKEDNELITTGVLTEEGIILIEMYPSEVVFKLESSYDDETAKKAILEIRDINKDVVATRTLAEFTDGIWKLEYLPVGKHYFVGFSDVPEGYIMPEEIYFVLNADGSVLTDGDIGPDGEIMIELSDNTPVVDGLTFNSESPAYDAETNTFRYDEENPLELRVTGRNLNGKLLNIGFFNSRGRQIYFLPTANEDTNFVVQFGKTTLDEILKMYAVDGLEINIVRVIAFAKENNNSIKEIRMNVKSENHIIVLNPNGADEEITAMVTSGGKLETLPKLERSGYKFRGWYDKEAGGKKITADTLFTENATIYAQWDKKSSGGGGGGGYSTVSTTVSEKADGSETKITVDKITGTKTETTTNADGSEITVETKKDGTITTTERDKEGNVTTTVKKPDGNITTEETPKDDAEEKDDDITTVPGDSSESPREEHNCHAKNFTDVDLDAWYHLNIDYALEKGLFEGITESTFAPDANLTRAMLVTVLYRAEGESAVDETVTFTDVEKDTYYASAVSWAQQNGIVTGISDKEFAPDNNITREQIAAILYRYAIYKGMEAVDLRENLSFDDAEKISEYAISALNWAVGKGLIKGYEDNTLRPSGNATRAEAAAILERFIGAN